MQGRRIRNGWMGVCGLILALAGWMATGCRRPAPPADPRVIVARVGTGVITLEEYESELRRLGGGDNPRQREVVLDDLIRIELLAQQARASGFEDSPAMRLRLRRYLARAYEEERLRADPPPPLPDDAAERYHREHPDEFRVEGKIRLAGVLVRVPAKADADARHRMEERAAAVRAEAEALGDTVSGLGDVARRHSEDTATRYRGGDQGWLTEAQVRDRWKAGADALLALDTPGAVAPLVEDAEGIWVLRLMERQPAGVRPWTDPVARELATHRAARAWEVRVAAERDARLREGVRVEVDRSVLPPAPPPPESVPPAPPSQPGS